MNELNTVSSKEKELTTIVSNVPSGEVDTRPGVQKQYEHEIMFIKSDGIKAAFSAREIVELCESYFRKTKVRELIGDKTPIIWTHTDGGKILATVAYGTKNNGEMLLIEIDKDGKVIRHSIHKVIL